MNKKEALRELKAVLHQSVQAVPLPRVESGPAPLTPAEKFLNSNPAPSQGSSVESILSSLLSSVAGGGSGGGSLLSALTGGRQSGGLSGFLGAGLSPIFSGLLGLFGGGGKSAPPPLPLYSAPQHVNLNASLQGGVISGADSRANGSSSSTSAPQITLHIQAMDTQSILNRRTDIASAVRQAMLRSHPINDVVADL